MEQLLHYVWKHKIYPLASLLTTTGQTVEVIDPGLPNTNAGPDFFNAKLKIGGTLWVGNVEVHTQASDWMRHGHDRDKAYDTVILHVVGVADCTVVRTNGEEVPQMVLPCPNYVRQRYDELHRADDFPPCHTILPALPKITVHSWFAALQVERFEQKAEAIRLRLEHCGGYWEDAFFVTLARNFGFGLNGEAFEAWGSRLPFRAVDKHRDNLFQVEALFFGTAGLLEDEATEADDYYAKLQTEYKYLSHKFDLPVPLSAQQWLLLRLRPGNFPHVRLAQLAALYHKERSLFSRVMEAATIDEVKKIFSARPSAYWESHFLFRRTSPQREKQIGQNALNLIVINTVIPFLYAYGRHKADERLTDRATRFLESLRAENNAIIRQWDAVGLTAATAADSQALIQLWKEYCNKRDCLRCRFGYEYLKRKPYVGTYPGAS